MKNTEKNLDDIIIEKRNKAYGAYALRKSYSKNVIRAMVIAFPIFLMGVSIPLIASYLNEERNISVDRIIDSVIIKKINIKPDIKLPDAPKPIEKKAPVFRPPVVTTNPEEVTSDLDELMRLSVNKNPNDTSVTYVTDVVEPTKVIEDDTDTPPPTFVEEMPEFPGGDAARIKFFSENVKYPQVAREIGVQGPVYLTFVVEKDGSISNIKLLRGIGAGCDEEAERVITLMPKWKPGRQNGKEVRVQFNMPISFILK
jgi:periplasmic protein TonB